MKRQYRAVNRFITKIKSTSSIDGVSSSGTFQVSDTTVSGFSLPQGACTFYVTADFAQTGKEEIFRIVNVSGDTLTYDKRISVGGYVKPAHTSGASIRINDVADIINDMSESIDNFGLISQIDGTQTVKVWGGVFNNMGTVYNVSSSTLAITGGQLSDNTTNYIHLVLSTQLFTVTASSTLAGAICMGSVVTSGGVIGTITDLRPAFSTTYGEIPTKLDKTGGLRDGMGASLQVLEIDAATGNEVKKAVVPGTSISPTETIRKRKADGTYEDITPGAFLSGAGLDFSQDVVAGEALTSNDSVVYEYIYASFPGASVGYGKFVTQKLGDVSGNTRLSMNIIGNGVSMSSITLGLAKNGAPTDNLIVRIETDSAGVPSGILAHANATANIAGTGLTGSYVNTTINFGGAFTLTNNTVYHIVVQRQNAVDGTNYYYISAVTKNVRCFKRNLHNGTSWGTASNTVSLYVGAIVGAYTRVIVKTVANFTELAAFDGFVTTTVSLGASTKINREGLMSGFSGLTDGTAYFLSNTPGVISATPGTTIREVGYAVGTTKLYIKNPLFNPSNYEFVVENAVSVISESPSALSANSQYTCRAIAKGRIGFGVNTGGTSQNLYVYINNTQVRTVSSTSIPVVFHDIYPGDLITAMFVYGGSGFYGRVVQFQQLLAPITRSE